MSVTRASFGRANNQSVELFTITNAHGLVMKVTNYGGIITELYTPDRSGRLANIVLGFDSLPPYLQPHPYFGATIGRFANRIAGGEFVLNGKTYKLPRNDGPNTLHGGPHGFDKVVWRATVLADGVRLDYTSPDGDQGFPGTLEASVIYRLTDDNHLLAEYSATSDQPTPVNSTNHSYFNLRGAGQGDVLGHVLYLAADAYTPVDATLIPTGEVRPVAGTPFDFRQALPIGARIAQLKQGHPQGGYDHNFVVRGELADLKRVALVSEPTTGRAMEVHSTQPGVQLYTGNFLDGSLRGHGGVYVQHGALCLETQHFPDSVHQPDFPSTILLPSETYHQRATFKFFCV